MEVNVTWQGTNAKGRMGAYQCKSQYSAHTYYGNLLLVERSFPLNSIPVASLLWIVWVALASNKWITRLFTHS
jgi:hypothetical protein